MASAGAERRVGKVVGYPPLLEMGNQQRREFHEALLEGRGRFEDLPGQWQSAVRRPSRAGRSCGPLRATSSLEERHMYGSLAQRFLPRKGLHKVSLDSRPQASGPHQVFLFGSRKQVE